MIFFYSLKLRIIMDIQIIKMIQKYNYFIDKLLHC